MGAKIKQNLVMVHTVSGCTAKFAIFLHPLYRKETNKPGYRQLHFFDSAEATTKHLENQPNHEGTYNQRNTTVGQDSAAI
jgi:hypothetical protein